MTIHPKATLGQCALAEHGVREVLWWEIGGTFCEPVYDDNESLNKAMEEYHDWLDSLYGEGNGV